MSTSAGAEPFDSGAPDFLEWDFAGAAGAGLADFLAGAGWGAFFAAESFAGAAGFLETGLGFGFGFEAGLGAGFFGTGLGAGFFATGFLAGGAGAFFGGLAALAGFEGLDAFFALAGGFAAGLAGFFGEDLGLVFKLFRLWASVKRAGEHRPPVF